MGRKKAKVEEAPAMNTQALYESLQLTPAQKAEGRDQIRRACEEAARNGVYERLLGLVGTGAFDIDFYRRLREDEHEDEQY